jgi:hypothetical protein
MMNAPPLGRRTRREVAAALLVTSALGAACYPALPPSLSPHVEGFVEAKGGSLGDWRLVATHITPVMGRIAVDVTNPNAPGLVLRIMNIDPPLTPAVGTAPRLARRKAELHVANLAGANGKTEVLLSPERCSKLDSIFRARGDGVAGSARFDCDFADEGHLVGDVAFSLVGYADGDGLKGHLDAADGALGSAEFAPNRCDADTAGVLFWDAVNPRVLFDFEREPSEGNTGGDVSNGTLYVTSTAPGGKSFDLSPRDCRVLRLANDSPASVVVGSDPTTLSVGTLDVDCTTPAGGRLSGRLRFVGC